MVGLERLTIRGFKSIEELSDFELGSLNVLVGANGAGKSNLIEFFHIAKAIAEQRLQAYFKLHGPADGYFYNGVSHTDQIDASIAIATATYCFTLVPTADGSILIRSESSSDERGRLTGSDEFESIVLRAPESPENGHAQRLKSSLKNWQIYHFHDTGMTAGMRRESGIEQTERLFSGAENLAAFLHGLRSAHPECYATIRKTVQRVAPFFDDFHLAVREYPSEDQVRLTWKQKGTPYIFSPGHLSDGTLRFICLATALLQPNPAPLIIFDEPELGLHPEALAILAGLLRSASSRTQIVVATQSPTLVSEFEPEEVITVDQVDGASRFVRLQRDDLAAWLNDYSLGELWHKGTIAGGIRHA